MPVPYMRTSLLVTALLLLFTLFFIVDALTPLGVADGISYVAVVLFSMLTNDRKIVIGSAVVAVVLTIAGYFLSPPLEDSLYTAFLNRALAICAIVICAALISIYQKSQRMVKEQQEKLELLALDLQLANVSLEARVTERTANLEAALHELEQSREQLKASLVHERELNEMKSRFVAMASHEFRTPLTTILSSLTLAMKYGSTGEPDKQQKHVLRIQHSVTHLTDLLDDILSISKLEEGKLPIQYEQFDLAGLTSEVLQEMQSIAAPGQSLQYEHNGATTVVLDKKAVRHILMNLVSNAIKFSPDNTAIGVTMNCVNDMLEIRVSDKGIGISETDQKHLFERFFRGANAINIQGTGLGLNIIAKYVELMKGNISCRSKPNEGSTFVILLPLKEPAPAGARA